MTDMCECVCCELLTKTTKHAAIEGQPYACLARPKWHRDDAKVFPDLESLVTTCDNNATFAGPDHFDVVTVYREGYEVDVPKEVYSVPDPVSKEEAESFIRKRLDSAPDSALRLRGAFRADPDLPFGEQVAQFIETSPWRWKTVAELECEDLGGKAL